MNQEKVYKIFLMCVDGWVSKKIINLDWISHNPTVLRVRTYSSEADSTHESARPTGSILPFFPLSVLSCSSSSSCGSPKKNTVWQQIPHILHKPGSAPQSSGSNLIWWKMSVMGAVLNQSDSEKTAVTSKHASEEMAVIDSSYSIYQRRVGRAQVWG